jgi:hypothetical protein
MRPTVSKLICATVLLVAAPGIATTCAGELGEILHDLTAPVRALHRKKPATCKDDAVERLAAEIDWLKTHINAYGSIVAKHPDVWGQNRLTRARYEYEEQLRAQLGAFQELNHASLRHSDQAFLGLAMTMGQTPATGRGTTATTRPAEATASVTNLISNPVGGGSPAETVIARTPPFAATSQPFADFGLANSNAVSLEPTIHLDHLSRYLNHLHELRRINEGDDIADAPGYALNLVRIPVSITPGQHTQAGHGAEITVIADPQLGDDLLPTTFRNLVLNDTVDMLAPGLTFAVNTTAVREAMRSTTADGCATCGGKPGAEATGYESHGTSSPGSRRGLLIDGGTTADGCATCGGKPGAEATGHATLSIAAVQSMRSQSVSVPTAKMRRARMPLPPEQLIEVIGERQVVLLLQSTYEALGAHPANTPCIDYPDVRGFLGEELQAAHDFLTQEPQQHVWADLPGWNLATLIRSRRIDELALRRQAFFDSLGVEETTTAVLAWAILVESALLNERLADDMRESGSAKGHAAGICHACAGPFYGPHPSPEARAAFNDYVRRRWPIRVFALDPVNDEQNVEEQYAQRREMQVAMAMAFASGRANGQALARYARRLETDLATVSLNKTAVGFTHGTDTFGWRFYPRMQPPPTRGSLATLSDTLCGSSPTTRDLASRRLEPGMRECTALIVMPSFVPFVTFDVRTNWFSLTHPKATDQSMRQAMLLSRSVQSMRQTAARCCTSTTAYRASELPLLLRSIEQLDRTLPLQTMLAQIPYENTAGGFELFNTGITDLAPELIGWYGAQGVDPNGTTMLFLVGKGFSVHDTSIIAGGRPVKTTLLSRQLLRAEIPPGVQTIRPAADSGCAAGDALSAARRRPSSIRLASNAEPLPAPAESAPPAAEGRPSLRLTLPPAAGLALPGAEQSADACGCGLDCHAREVVDVHLATPYGVSGHLLIPVIGVDRTGADRCTLSFASGNVLRLTATKTKAGTWRVNEFFTAVPDAIRIAVPAVFAPPAKGSVNFLLRDAATGATAGTFSIPAPPFDGRTQDYVLAGADLRNFVGDTARPATDKTLRGAIKPYLDSLGTGTTTDGGPTVNRDLTLTAELVTDQKTIPIEGTITVEVRESNQAADPTDPIPATP